MDNKKELINKIVLEVEDLVTSTKTDYYGRCPYGRCPHDMDYINFELQKLLNICFKLQNMI